VPQHVRVDVHVEARGGGPALDPLLHFARREATPCAPHEKRVLAGFRHLLPRRQPGIEGRERVRAHGNDACLRALAGHAHFARFAIDVAEVEARQLRNAQAARIRELEERAIAKARGVASSKLTRRTAWSGESACGRFFAAFGARTPAHGFALTSRLRASQS
jgi:hypothetical protein